MFRQVTRQLTRRSVQLRPRLAIPPLPRFTPSLQRSYSPRAPFTTTESRSSPRELKPIEEDDAEPERTEEDETVGMTEEEMENLSFSVPDEVISAVLEHGERHWPKATSVPEGWSTDWPAWDLVATLWAPSPLFLMLPQAALLLLRFGIKPWTGLVPSLGQDVPAGSGITMYSEGAFVVRIDGVSYLIDYSQPESRVFRLEDGDPTRPVEQLKETTEGCTLCDQIMSREDSVREALFQAGYTPFVLEPTTEQQEATVLEEADQDVENGQIKAQIDEMLVGMGIDPPEDMDEWNEVVQKVAEDIQAELGSTFSMYSRVLQITDAQYQTRTSLRKPRTTCRRWLNSLTSSSSLNSRSRKLRRP